MYDRLIEVLQLRPTAILVHSQAGAIETTYASLIEALSPSEVRD